MPDTQTQLRKGTTAQNNAFTGAVAEVTVDTTKWIAVVHDGVTAGGFPLAGTMFANVFSKQQRITTVADAPQLILTEAPGQSTETFQIFKSDGVTKLLGHTFDGNLEVYRQTADTTGAQIHHFKKGTTGSATAAVGSGDQLSQDNYKGWDGAAFVNGAQLRVVTREIFTPTARGSQFEFYTVAIGATGLALVATLNTSKLLLDVPLDMGTHLINNVVNPVAAQDAATKNYVDSAVGGTSPPFTDTTPLVKGSADATKLMRFEVDGFTAATTRVLTPPNADITLAGINIAQTFAEDQTFGKRILLPNTSSATVGGIYFGGARAFHNFGSANTFVGVNAGNFTLSGGLNSVFGYNAGNDLDTGYQNSFFGYASGTATTIGYKNSFFGFSAGAANDVGNYNSFFGLSAGQGNVNGSYNSFFGTTAGGSNISGSNNSFFGRNAGGGNTTGADNAAFGRQAGEANSSGDFNSFFGASAGQSAGGNYNAFFGTTAGFLAIGNDNTIFGAFCADNLTSGEHNIFIGSRIDAPSATTNNQLSIGNIIFGTGVDGVGAAISTGNIGIAVVTPHSGLQVGRSFALPYRAIAATDTFAASDYTINATSGTFTVNLPTAVGITGRIYVAKNSGVGTITLDPDGAELIDGSATATIVAGAALMVQSTGAGWIII